MKRWHQEFRRSYNEWRKHYLGHVEANISFAGQTRIGKSPYEIDCICDRQPGRFRKMKAWDCGKTRCGICHCDKFPKRKRTIQEKKSNLALKEGILEWIHHQTTLRRNPILNSVKGQAR